MAKIHVLPDILAHKIAAGEVVERPSSVVKELIENALDAQATRVEVEVAGGGRELILVRDNGVGLGPEDAPLAFHHHATSKIREFEDLSRISTLGFRGEALPSIASISRLRLRTVERRESPGEASGTEVQLEGGTLKSVREISWPEGTEVRVEELFFNVPARRKFLKTRTTELQHISRQVTHHALAHPAVEFRFSHDGKCSLAAPAVSSHRERIYQVLGGTFLDDLTPVEYQKDGIRIEGFTSLPHHQRSNANALYLFVNRRAVRDRTLTHAVRLAYQDLMPRQAYPAAVIFVEIDPERIDVNVHPSKTEIRFAEPDQAHRALRHALQEALLPAGSQLSSLARDVPPGRLHSNGYAQGPRMPGALRTRDPRQGGIPLPVPSNGHGWVAESGPEVPHSTASFVEALHGDEIPETTHLDATPVVLGQFVESFVVTADRDGVMLVDQHVAHERILYDQALRQLESETSCPVQRLLIPITIDLNSHQLTLLELVLEELNANGFEVEWFGEGTVAVKGMPAFAADCDAARILQDILDGADWDTRDLKSPVQRIKRLREEIAISSSCRRAIKINTPLTPEKMQWLLDELFRCRNPHTCPHGRPIVLRMGIEDILKGFKRI